MSRVDAIVAQISGQIASGFYRAGQKLPSVRGGAGQFGVSKNTMAEAYDRLVAQGLAVARQGSGYFITGNRPLPAPRLRPDVTEATSIVSLLREQLDQHYETRPGDGRPPATWTEVAEMRRILRAGRRSDGAIDFGYGSSWGLGALRDWLRMSLAERSILTEPDGIMLTSGVNHGLDLIIRQLLEPGDTVFVDSPGYYPLFAKLRLAKVTVVPVRRIEDGPDLDDLRDKLAGHRPKVFFTQSQAHNPTGGTLSPATAFGLLQLADLHDFRIVEDDIFADLLAPTLPRLAAFGRQERVLYVGSFSKTLSASLRCGYIAGSPDLVRGLVDLKMITTVATSAHVERLVTDMIESGQYIKHLRRLRTRMQEGAKGTVQALSEVGLDVSLPRVQGFYLWVPLPETLDEAAFCRRAAAADIFIAPASVFHTERDACRRPAMRVNVAYGADPRFCAFLRRELEPG
ncbi:PLP-dependent aminotransferase family protein [Paracoccus versutus]|uniref:DNA-binding transcriptional MocR family regulator n=1 Tax=Paracoccus versutus TaxID=34007 RepID=A0AAQ0HHR6_PARVE|nr:PLP-dependent aminotransferase family protein [Paracoccus versutus]KGJ07950.1 GntR family transcriptional regulator [Paracoccus versutus]REG47667.1 DNA-binding transcriptional MocR family regulator [Paracoccus versutus]WEJ79805.1 PLP-dependent aminotransferase family protein [Paracoccus versutus]